MGSGEDHDGGSTAWRRCISRGPGVCGIEALRNIEAWEIASFAGDVIESGSFVVELKAEVDYK